MECDVNERQGRRKEGTIKIIKIDELVVFSSQLLFTSFTYRTFIAPMWFDNSSKTRHLFF